MAVNNAINSGAAITLGGALTISGAFTTTLTVTNTTALTLPTSGTLATTSQLPTLPLTLANGGTGAAITASNGGIFYSNASTGALLSGTATAGQALLSGASTTPVWSTPTYPSASGGVGTILRSDGTNNVYTTSTYPNTNAINTILYASSANVMSALATANTAVLATNGSGVPSLTATPTVTSITFGSGTALSVYAEGTFTPTMIGASVAGTTTYTKQVGFYTKIGNLVTVNGTVNYSAATGTGDMTLGALPFTIKNQSGGNPVGSVVFASAVTTWPAGTTSMQIEGSVNTTTAVFYCTGTASNGGSLQVANTAGGFAFTLTYQV